MSWQPSEDPVPGNRQSCDALDIAIVPRIPDGLTSVWAQYTIRLEPGRRDPFAAALKAEGITMSAPYLSQLRSGNRTNPSAATMAALANFFRIKPAYFTDDDYYEKLDKELSWLADMRDDGVRRIAARTLGLSSQAQDDVAARVEELRRKEHLDA